MNKTEELATVPPEDKAEYLKKGKSFETSQNDTKSFWLKMGWSVAGVMSFLLAGAIAAIIVMTLRFHPFGFLVERDKITGETATFRSLDVNTIDYEEAKDRHNVKRYVEACESYIFEVLQRDYDVCLELSANGPGQDYARKFEGKNALDKTLGRGTKWRINVLSVRLPKDEPGKAVVGYEKVVIKDGLDPEPPIKMIATLSYKYEPKAKRTDFQWNENPENYKTTAFRADRELTSSAPPPAPIDGAAPPVTPAQ